MVSGEGEVMSEPDSPPDVQPGERARALQAVEILLRMLRLAIDRFEGDDCETILVLLTVVAGSAAVNQRDEDVIQGLNAAPLSDEHLRPLSGRAIAASSGLPRETVRRRLEQLVAEGRLVRDERGYRMVFDPLSRGGNLEFGRALIRELEGAPRRLARFDSV